MTWLEDRELTAPEPNEESCQYWEATREQQLLIGFCKDTGKKFFYPRAVSPFTLSSNVEWIKANGRGTIYTYSVMQRVPVPFALAYVELDEGPMMLTNIVECESDDIRIGMAVRVVFKPSVNGPPIPMFKPA
jgi:uncharacterized OB-fold protein